MKPEERDYILHCIADAEETIEESKLLVQSGHLRGAVNRIYYACFYAVSALLLVEGWSASKHKGVQVLFDRHWIATSRLPREMGQYFRRLFDRRLLGDYGRREAFVLDDVEAWLSEGVSFVARIRKEVEGLLPKA